MARRDPWVNMLRTTAACAGAAFGGADAVTVLPFTWAMGKPDAFARRVARNTQLVLQEESALGRVADPGHGAWYIEKLTDDLANAGWAQFQAIEAKGGMAARARERLHPGRDRQGRRRARPRHRRRPRSSSRASRPSRCSPTTASRSSRTPCPSPSSKAARRSRRCCRAAWRSRSSGCAMPPTPIRRGPASGRRCSWPRSASLPCIRHARCGCATSSPPAASRPSPARRCTTPPTPARPSPTAAPTIACIASSDQVYAELAEATAGALKAAGATHVLLAGRPKAQEAALKAAGVDTFIFAGCDAVATLSSLHEALGVRP